MILISKSDRVLLSAIEKGVVIDLVIGATVRVGRKSIRRIRISGRGSGEQTFGGAVTRRFLGQ